jgi:hypothetical protein
MLLLTWKYAFPSRHIAHATLGYISLNVKKDSEATFEKNKKEKRRKSESERERKGQVSY